MIPELLIVVAGLTEGVCPADGTPMECALEDIRAQVVHEDSVVTVACGGDSLIFSGQLIGKYRGGHRRQILSATYHAELGEDVTVSEELEFDHFGRFSVTLPRWRSCLSHRGRETCRVTPKRATVTVSATGCRSRTFRVGPNWRDRTVALRCDSTDRVIRTER